MIGNFEIIINDSKPVVVDFHALWCSPCKAQTPILKEVANLMGDKVRIIKIDIDKHNTLALKYQIQSVPTLIIFKNGKPFWRQSGVVSKSSLIDVIQKANSH